VKFSHGVIAGALVVLVAACGGGNTPSGSTTPESRSSSSAAPAASPTTTPPPDLNSELLATSDLPGWSAEGSSDSGEPKCLDNVRSALRTASKAEAAFVDGSSGLPTLEESLAYVPGQGRSDMTAVSRILAGCGPSSLTTAGQTLSGTVSKMSFPGVADQSSACQMNLSGTLSGVQATLDVDIVVFRKADTMAMILFGNLGTPNRRALHSIVQDAAAKLS
jgi:hypothetical protein